jgi:hypothetical protein
MQLMRHICLLFLGTVTPPNVEPLAVLKLKRELNSLNTHRLTVL